MNNQVNHEESARFQQFMFVVERSSKLLTGSRSFFWENGEGSARVFLEDVPALWAIPIGPLGCMLRLVRVT